jgi:hypothetical protein
MKHLAVRSFSLHSARPFTATGLGDRIHQLTCAWCYGAPVTLHIDRRKMEGGQFGNKPESWREILSLFPEGSLALQWHDIYPDSEAEWLRHLSGVPIISYSDFAGDGLDIVPYLRDIQKLSMPARHPLPERYGTQQWDASAPSRRVEPVQFDVEMITVGGEGKDPYRWSLRDIAAAMSGAEFHAGVDSGFMHLALLYLPTSKIRLYTSGAESHHLKRARANGASVVKRAIAA